MLYYDLEIHFCFLSRYLHEVCNPPVVHRNFKSCNVLLEDDLTVRVSDCGLAPLLSSSSMAQVKSFIHKQIFLCGFIDYLVVDGSSLGLELLI